jgi:hypothetical protein
LSAAARALVELPRAPGRAANVAQLVRTRLRRGWLGLRRLARSPKLAGGDAGPRFEVSGHRASFEELERIVFHPEVMAKIETAPRAALQRPVRPAPELPPGSDALGSRRRATPAPVFDVVPLGMELDLLELRLAELEDVVDVFVVAEAPRAYGGMKKPLYLQRNWQRFAPFHGKLRHVVIDAPEFDSLYPSGRRERTDWLGDYFHRARMWEAVRRMGLPPDAVVIAGDLDELLPRWLIHLLKHYECPLPLRVATPTLRYNFGWLDEETTGNVTVVSPASFSHLDRHPATFWELEARVFQARGAVHLTSFLDPTLLIAKFALTTDWDPGILPYLRNEHGETAAMVREGTWFGRAVTPYDADADPRGLVPEMARRNRARYRGFWE